MSDFRFFVVSSGYNNRHLYIVKNGIKHAHIKTGAYSGLGINTLDKRIGSTDVFEIKSLHRLLPRLNNPNTRLFVHDESGDIEFSSVDEVKEYFLIRKLTGL